jgi:hypothetical protein
MIGQKRYLAIFIATVLLLLGTIAFVNHSNSKPYELPFDFSTIGEDKILAVNGLHERYRSALKISYAINVAQPKVGVFGSNSFMNITKQSFGLNDTEFFNFYVTHIGLPGIRDMMLELAAGKALPSDLAVIHLQNPHAANWQHIALRVWDLPLSVYALRMPGRITKRIRKTIGQLGASIQSSLSLSFAMYKIFKGGFAPTLSGCKTPRGIFTISQTKVQQKRGKNPKFDGIAKFLEKYGLLKPPDRQFTADCGPISGFRNDGSFRGASATAPQLERTGELPKNPLPAAAANEIADLMKEINAIGAANGTTVVFLAPPVFEIKRKSEMTEMLDKALARVKGSVHVIDMRDENEAAENFEGDHTVNDHFMAKVVTELKHRRLFKNKKDKEADQ